MADIETLENFYLRVVIPPLAAALVTALACAILGSFDLWLGVALLVFVLLTGVVLPLASRWLSRQPAAAAIATRADAECGAGGRDPGHCRPAGVWPGSGAPGQALRA